MKFINNLKKQGKNDEYIEKLKNKDELRTMMSEFPTGKVAFLKNLSRTQSDFNIFSGKSENKDESLERSKLASSNTAQRSEMAKITNIKVGKQVKNFFRDIIIDKVNKT